MKINGLVELPYYDPLEMTLHIVLLLSSPNATVDVISPHPMFQRYIVNYEFFSIILVSTFTFILSGPEGWISHHATTEMVTGGNTTGELAPVVPGVNPTDASEGLARLFLSQHLEHAKRVMKGMRQVAPENSFIWQYLTDRMSKGFVSRPDEVDNYALSDFGPELAVIFGAV
jgi:hypothetical protein